MVLVILVDSGLIQALVKLGQYKDDLLVAPTAAKVVRELECSWPVEVD